jgi:hypothetical protein
MSRHVYITKEGLYRMGKGREREVAVTMMKGGCWLPGAWVRTIPFFLQCATSMLSNPVKERRKEGREGRRKEVTEVKGGRRDMAEVKEGREGGSEGSEGRGK